MEEDFTDIQDKLVVLYVLDKMELPLAEESVLAICATVNNWLPYINCKHILEELTDKRLVHKSVSQKAIYSITPSGRACLSNFYTKIPLSRREEITEFVQKERLAFKRKQELFHDYTKNRDGTYNVRLRICEMDAANPMLDIQLNVDTRKTAKYIYDNWEKKAAKIYELLYDNLFDQ